MNPHLEKRGAFARSAAPRLFLAIPERSPKWYWQPSMVIRVCVQANIFSPVLKLPGMRSSMHSQSMRNGPGNGALMASRYRFSVLCIRRLSLFGRRAFSGSDIDTKGPAVTSRARASQVRLLSIIPLCSRMQRKIQRAGFRVRAQLLH
jgi:hypothetical protein